MFYSPVFLFIFQLLNEYTDATTTSNSLALSEGLK